MKLYRLIYSCATSAFAIAAGAQVPTYSIAMAVSEDFGIQGLNNQGDVLYQSSDGYHVLRSDGSSAVFGNTVSGGAFPFAVPTGISDSGVCYGLAFTPNQGDGTRAAVWTEQSGWQVMPIGPLKSQGVGVTATGRVLCRGSDTLFGEPLNSGWWQIGSNPVSIPGNSLAMGCNSVGDAVFTTFGGSWVTRANGTNQTLQWNGVISYASQISSNGLICGIVPRGFSGLPNVQGVVWNTDGTVSSSVALQAYGNFTDVNSSGLVIGNSRPSAASWDDAAILYSTQLGVIRLSSLMTPTFAGWKFSSANKINDRGQIVAVGTAPGSTETKYVLLNPVPEPATCASLGLGLIALLRRRRRSGE